MRFQDKLKNREYAQIWSEYCGFLDLSMDEYMHIQRRLMEEQIELWSASELGKAVLDGKTPTTIDEFRSEVPLTTYDDYASMLFQKQNSILPDDAVVWIHTTWEGGMHPIKVAPYTHGMLETYRRNIIACMILATSTVKGKFDIKVKDKILYALAPLPYATGLYPLALNDEIDIQFLPPVSEAVNMTFSERNKKGFKLGMRKGIEFFFGLGSVAYYVSTSLSKLSSGGAGSFNILKCSPVMLKRLIVAKYRCKAENRELKPRDLFKLKGFMVAGTDNRCYKDDLEELWGVRPMELFAGTEPTCIGTETWTRDGMYFFPDACFYEFIPENEMNKSLADTTYKPVTYLMDEVVPGDKYELVISVLKGGAFMRYRVGDVYRCVGIGDSPDNTAIPRFEYIDRVPTIIDIAGFTRISEKAIETVVTLSGLAISRWTALKEYNEQKRPYLHMYVELNPDSLVNQAVSKEILREQLSIYFRHMDHDYKDLKKILGIDPLEITILKFGTFERYKNRTGQDIKRLNPTAYEIKELIGCQ